MLVLISSVAGAMALLCLALWLTRLVRVRRDRKELERQEDAKRTIERLREAFRCEELVSVTGDQGSQFS
jgi:hypothetical protein